MLYSYKRLKSFFHYTKENNLQLAIQRSLQIIRFVKMPKTNITSLGLPFLVKNIITLFRDTKIFDSFSSLIRALLSIEWIFKTEKNEAIGSEAVSAGQEKLSKEEVKTVMNCLGIICCGKQGDDDHNVLLLDQIGEEEILEVFDEEEPSLDELKEAFGVFDDNKDGFIDASELGRVLCSLGLIREEYSSGTGTDHERLRMMIKTVDENGDGVIDFNEFLKFMED